MKIVLLEIGVCWNHLKSWMLIYLLQEVEFSVLTMVLLFVTSMRTHY